MFPKKNVLGVTTLISLWKTSKKNSNINDIYQIRTDPPYDNYEIRNCDKNKKMYPHSPSRNCDIILSHTISFNRRQALIVE